MISWIQRYFQKHFKLVFLLLLAGVGIPMVFIYSASGGLGRASSRQRQDVSLFGHDWSPGDQRAALEIRARLSGELSGNGLAASPEGRAALIHFADKFGVPVPTNTQLADFIRTRPVFQGPDGQYDAQSYQRIRDMLVGGVIGYTEAQVRQVLMEDWRLEQVQQAIVGPGYVSDAEIKRAFAESEALWSVTTATLDLAKVQSTAEPTEDELRIWFESSMARYETPSQVLVDYVEFSPANYVSGEPPKDEDIVAYFERNKQSYQKAPVPGPDGTTPPAVEVQLGDVREKVIADLLRSRAIRKAEEAASNLSARLTRDGIAVGSPEFDAFMAASNLTVKKAPPFGPNEWPLSLEWNPTIANAAWRLTPASAVSNKLRAGDNSIVLFLKGRTQPVPATFETARSRVVADVKADKRRQAIVARGQELQRQLAAAVAGGQSFDEAAKAAGLETKSWEKFKISERPPEGLNPSIYQNLPQQKVREVSQMVVQGETGTIVFVKERQEPDPAVAAEAYAQMRSGTMDSAARFAANVAMRELVEKARIAGGITTPDDVQ